MGSRRGNGRPFNVANNDDFSSIGKGVSQSNSNVEQLTQGFAGTNLNSGQDDGEWEVYAKKTKNKAGGSAPKQWGSPAHNSNPRAWGNTTGVGQKPGMQTQGGVGRAAGNPWQPQNANYMRPAGRGNGSPQFATSGYEHNNAGSIPLIRPPLKHGWIWQARAGSLQSNVNNEIAPEEFERNDDAVDDDDEDFNDYDDLEDTDEDLMSDDDESDASQKSHETRKKSRWFSKFFENLDGLTIEAINEPERRWHCPACQNGPGAIHWFRGLQPLLNHAKTKGSKRVKIHRVFAEILYEELRRRGTKVVPAGEAFGEWEGLNGEIDDEIVWPPTVIIQNTKLERDDNGKWLGMGNQELLDYFSNFAAVRARHAYGPQGHRGMSFLIFEASATGYLEAERLHKHFADQFLDKNAWFGGCPMLFYPGGKRQLYGYMASKGEMDSFNKHCKENSGLEYETRSYQEMVVCQIRQMSEDNQQLMYFKNKVVKVERTSKSLERTFSVVTDKLRKAMEENRIVKQKTKMQREEIKEEMSMQEKFFRKQIRVISRNAKEEGFERIQQEEREKVKKCRADGYVKFVELQDKEMEDFVAAKDKLCQAHEERITAMKLSHWQEEVEMENKFDEDVDKLVEKYFPSQPGKNSNGN